MSDIVGAYVDEGRLTADLYRDEGDIIWTTSVEDARERVELYRAGDWFVWGNDDGAWRIDFFDGEGAGTAVRTDTLYDGGMCWTETRWQDVPAAEIEALVQAIENALNGGEA